MTLEVARGIKPPPEKPEAEASLLGAMLMDGSIYNEVARGRLAPADLSREQHRLVLAAIARVAERSEAVGFASVQSDLAARDEVEAIGGPQFLVSLMQNVPTVAHAESYAAIVERTALLRRLIGSANEIARLALTRDEATSAVADAQELLFSMREAICASGSRRVSRRSTRRPEACSRPTSSSSPADPGSGRRVSR